jgi:purine-binding chemotaxis protein CheW
MTATNGQVLEFERGGETYCVSIDDVTEIVDVGGSGEASRIIVLEPWIVEDQGAAGWLVDEVNKVVGLDERDVEESPGDGDEAIHGVVRLGEGDFVIWVDSRTVHAAG